MTTSRRRAIVVALSLLVIAGIGSVTTACTGQSAPARSPETPPILGAADAAGDPTSLVMEIHRSAACGCCGEYEDYLVAHGVEIQSVIREDVFDLKRTIGLPGELASCHTGFIAGYYVEGHVPVEAIRDLIEHQSRVDGIALPGMPSGSPGMGGTQAAPFVIFGVASGTFEEWGTY